MIGALFTVVSRVEVYLDFTTEDVAKLNFEYNRTLNSINDTRMIFHNESENLTDDEEYWEIYVKIEHANDQNFTHKNLNEAELKYNKDQGQGQGQDEHDIQSFIVSVCVIFVASLSSTIEAVIISGSPLKDGNTIIFSLWYFIIGATFP